ncbi:MAG: transcription antitermination factor NusB [Microbacteriaceae bacterium]
MSAVQKARKRALDLLYASDLIQKPLEEVLEAEAVRARKEPDRAESWAYARQIVQGVLDHTDEIDEKIEMFSYDWPLHRMPVVDRNILRLSSWELLYREDLDRAIVISEAILLAKEYSTEESAKFVNAILAKIAR